VNFTLGAVADWQAATGYRMFLQTGQPGRLREQTKKQIAENNPATVTSLQETHNIIYFNRCHYIYLSILTCSVPKWATSFLWQPKQCCYPLLPSQVLFRFSLCYNFNSPDIAGRRSRVASLLLLPKKPLIRFRKGSEQSKDNDNVNLKHNNFALIGSKEKHGRSHKE